MHTFLYTKDNSVKLGFKAGVVVHNPVEQYLKGDANFKPSGDVVNHSKDSRHCFDQYTVKIVNLI